MSMPKNLMTPVSSRAQLSILADKWMIELGHIEDLVGNDEALDFADLKLLVDNWFWQSN